MRVSDVDDETVELRVDVGDDGHVAYLMARSDLGTAVETIAWRRLERLEALYRPLLRSRSG